MVFYKGHKTRVGLKHSEEFKRKRKESGNPNWKGDSVKSHALHSWINDNFKCNGKCEKCNSTKHLEWSNKDHTYNRDRSDWQRLCRSCHMKYDYNNNLRVKPYAKKKKSIKIH